MVRTLVERALPLLVILGLTACASRPYDESAEASREGARGSPSGPDWFRDAWKPEAPSSGADETGPGRPAHADATSEATTIGIPAPAVGRWSGEAEFYSWPWPAEVSVALYGSEKATARTEVGEVEYEFGQASCSYWLVVEAAGDTAFTVSQRPAGACPGRGSIRFWVRTGDWLLGEWYHANGAPWFLVRLTRVAGG